MFKKIRCKGCNKKIKEGEETADLRLDTADGPIELLICNDCAQFWDMSADILKRRNGDEIL